MLNLEHGSGGSSRVAEDHPLQLEEGWHSTGGGAHSPSQPGQPDTPAMDSVSTES